MGEGAKWLAVSSVDEGVTLRCAVIQGRILVMAGFLPYEGPALVEYDLTPAAHSLADVTEVERLAQSSGKPLRYHLKIDSGMSRLGTRAGAAEIVSAVTAARLAKLEALMTHLASAADYASPQTDAQAAQFHALAAALAHAGIRPDYVHMASTNAIAYGRRDAWHNMVRAGHAIYGYLSPARGPAPPRILQVE